MSDDLQAQIDELKDRVSIYEQLLTIGSMIISDLSSNSAIHEECKDYTDIVELHTSPEKQTKHVTVLAQCHPHLYRYMESKGERAKRIIDF